MLLITGATGFLGGHVVERLLRHPVTAYGPLRIFVRQRRRVPAHWPVDVVEGDLQDAGAVERAVAGARAILHLAGVSSAGTEAGYLRMNAEPARRLLEAACRHGVERFVFASSRLIDARAGGYARSKAAVERLIADRLTDYVIVRLGELYGANDRRGVMALLAWMRRHRWVPVMGTDRCLMAPLHVEDAAAAMVAALARGRAGQVYTITGPDLFTYGELVEAIEAALQGRRMQVRLPPRPLQWILRAAAPCCGDRLAYDQVDRLCAPRELMPPHVPQELGVSFRRFSEALPMLLREAATMEAPST